MKMEIKAGIIEVHGIIESRAAGESLSRLLDAVMWELWPVRHFAAPKSVVQAALRAEGELGERFRRDRGGLLADDKLVDAPPMRPDP